MENTSIQKIAAALVKAQAEMSNANKGATNPFFKSKYADLNAIREACIPALNAHGITLLQPIIYDNGKSFVKTLLLHESGECLEGVTEVVCVKQNDPQAYGSALTYARRYGMQSMVNIGSEDDDGNKANNLPKKNDKEKSELQKKYYDLVTESSHVLNKEEQQLYTKSYLNWDISRLNIAIGKLQTIIFEKEEALNSEEHMKQLSKTI